MDTILTDPAQPPPTPKISVTRADFAVGDVEEDEQEFQGRRVRAWPGSEYLAESFKADTLLRGEVRRPNFK